MPWGIHGAIQEPWGEAHRPLPGLSSAVRNVGLRAQGRVLGSAGGLSGHCQADLVLGPGYLLGCMGGCEVSELLYQGWCSAVLREWVPLLILSHRATSPSWKYVNPGVLWLLWEAQIQRGGQGLQESVSLSSCQWTDRLAEKLAAPCAWESAGFGCLRGGDTKENLSHLSLLTWGWGLKFLPGGTSPKCAGRVCPNYQSPYPLGHTSTLNHCIPQFLGTHGCPDCQYSPSLGHMGALSSVLPIPWDT